MARCIIYTGIDKTLCNQICQWLAADMWYSPGTRVNFIHQYNWNIVESGVKYHSPNPC